MTGANGLITKADNAQIETKKAEGLEKIQLAVVASYDNGNNINTQTLAKNLSYITGLTDTNDTQISQTTEITLPKSVKLNNYKYKIKADGTVAIFKFRRRIY